MPGGAIGVRFDGVELLPCVSQGATPVGPELEITSGEGRPIKQLGGRPALGALRGVLEDLDESEREMLAEGMLLGIVVESGFGDSAPTATATSSCAASWAAIPRPGRSPSARRSRRARSCASTPATRRLPTAISTMRCNSPAGARRRRPGRCADVHVHRPRSRDVRPARPRRQRGHRQAIRPPANPPTSAAGAMIATATQSTGPKMPNATTVTLRPPAAARTSARSACAGSPARSARACRAG